MSLQKVFKTVISVERWRSNIVCFSSLLAKCGLNLPPFGISGSWPPSLYIQLLTMPWGRILNSEFWNEIQTKVLRVFLLAMHSHLYSFALRFLFLETHATSYSFYSSFTAHCKGEKRKTWQKTWQKTIPPTLCLRNPYRNLKSENSQDYAQKTQRNSMFMKSASVQFTLSI